MRQILVLLGVLFAVNLYAQDVPFMAHEDFEFELDYKFETKPPPEQNKVNMVEEVQYTADLLPYVRMNFSFPNPPEDAFRVRVLSGRGGIIKSRKMKKIDVLDLDLGFADDIKDRVKPHSFYIYIENKDKERISKIKIFVEESGNFYLNDKLYGKI